MTWTDMAWKFCSGILSCDPRNTDCVVDWNVISAIATAAAVAVAMVAIWIENKHRNVERTRADSIRALELEAARNREMQELDRQEAARKSSARRLAKIFDRELTEAARELLSLIKLTEALSPQNVGQYQKLYAAPLSMAVFQMHERFLNHLDVFPDMLAIAIVNNMTNWSSITLFSEGLDASPGIDLMRVRPKILAELNEVLVLIGETKLELEEYFADLPGLKVLTLEEVRSMNAAKADEQARKLSNLEKR